MIKPINAKTVSSAARRPLDWPSPDSWAVSAAVIFILLVVAGVFPHVSW